MNGGWRDTARLIGIPVPTWQQPLFDYLEQHGHKFCVHFGLANAWDKAHALYWGQRPDEDVRLEDIGDYRHFTRPERLM